MYLAHSIKHCSFIDELPKSSIGKILKKELRVTYSDLSDID
jgi:acyl-coenzyme A synthetase/AMP-(fatty) acid ligase